MRRRKDARVRSSAGQVGSQGVRKSRLASRSAAHSAWSAICGARNRTLSPMIAGPCSEKLTVRKNAIDIASSGGLAYETFGDRSRAVKAGARTERRDRGPAARNQRTPGGACALNGDAFDARYQLVERDRPTPREHLARELLGACARAFERHQESRLHLRLGA